MNSADGLRRTAEGLTKRQQSSPRSLQVTLPNRAQHFFPAPPQSFSQSSQRRVEQTPSHQTVPQHLLAPAGSGGAHVAPAESSGASLAAPSPEPEPSDALESPALPSISSSSTNSRSGTEEQCVTTTTPATASALASSRRRPNRLQSPSPFNEFPTSTLKEGEDLSTQQGSFGSLHVTLFPLTQHFCDCGLH